MTTILARVTLAYWLVSPVFTTFMVMFMGIGVGVGWILRRAARHSFAHLPTTRIGAVSALVAGCGAEALGRVRARGAIDWSGSGLLDGPAWRTLGVCVVASVAAHLYVARTSREASADTSTETAVRVDARPARLARVRRPGESASVGRSGDTRSG